MSTGVVVAKVQLEPEPVIGSFGPNSHVVRDSPVSVVLLSAATGPGGFGGGSGSSDKTFSFAGTVLELVGTARWYATTGADIAYVLVSVNSPPTGADLIVDVRKNGTSIFTDPATRPTVPDGENVAWSVPAVTGLVRQTDYLQVDVVQVGSTSPGSDLDVQIAFV